MLTFRFATNTDVDTYFEWTNDALTRQNSYNSEAVEYDKHVNWFKTRLTTPECKLYLFINETEEPVGQVRIERKGQPPAVETVIAISVDGGHRGKGYGTEMLNIATDHYLRQCENEPIKAYIFKSNNASVKSFIKAGFVIIDQAIINGVSSYILIKEKKV